MHILGSRPPKCHLVGFLRHIPSLSEPGSASLIVRGIRSSSTYYACHALTCLGNSLVSAHIGSSGLEHSKVPPPFALQCTYSLTHPEASFQSIAEIAFQCTYRSTRAQPATHVHSSVLFFTAHIGMYTGPPCPRSMWAPVFKHIYRGVRIRSFTSNARTFYHLVRRDLRLVHSSVT